MAPGSYRYLVSLFILSAIALSSCRVGYQTTFEPGSTAPDISFVTPSGEKRTLSSYRGKVVLLNLWASWCSECRSEIPALEALQRELGPRGFRVVAVSIDSDPEQLRTFLDSRSLNYVVGREDEPKAATLYKTTGVPETFLLDKEGRFVLVQDPDSREAVTRILGPRRWGSQHFMDQIAKLL